MNETTKKIKELREEVERLNNEIMKLERENSKFYIGVCYDVDGNYWDEYYHRLGYITEEQAKAWANEQMNKEDVYKARYFEVTKEIYAKYGDWVNLDNLQKSINLYSPAIANLEGVNSFVSVVKKAKKNVIREIGIEFPEYMHPVCDY